MPGLPIRPVRRAVVLFVPILPTLLPALLLALLLGACQRAPEPAPAVQDAEPPAPNGEFALLEAHSDTTNGRPALLLRFSRPLASAQPFDDLIEVTGPGGAPQTGGWVLDEEASVLRFPFVQADQTYTVSILPALSAADGAQLPAPIQREVYSGALPPTVGFASQGSVLPARDGDGLPVISVNVNEVDVEFLRVRDKELPVFFNWYQSNGQRGWWELQQIGRIADPVYANRFALDSRPNERVVNLLPVQNIAELREPGLYFAVMRRAGNFEGRMETALFFVSDLGLHLRVHGERLWLHAASLASGESRSGVQVEILDKKGNRVAEAVTGGDGNATLQRKLQAEEVLVARRGGDLSLISFRQPALDLSEFDVAGSAHRAREVFAWSPRDLYRPDETLQVSALLRDHDGRLLPGSQPLLLTLKQPDGQAVASAQLEPQALAYYDWSHPISADAATGRWSLEFRLDPKAEPVGTFGFRVEEFLPERLKLALDSPAPRLEPGQALPLRVQADYLYGAPASGNRFTAQVLYRADQQPLPQHRGYFFGDPTVDLPKEPQDVLDAQLGDNGALQVDLEIAPEVAALQVPIEIVVSGSVFESGGRAVRRGLKRTVWPAATLVGVRPMFDVQDGPGANSRAGFEILRSDAEGESLPAAGLKARLVRELRDYHWAWQDGSGWRSDFIARFEVIDAQEVMLDGQRPARVDFPVEWGEYRLEIDDPETGLTMRYPFTAGWSWGDANRGLDARPDKVKLALDKTSYAAGESLRVTITPPHSGPGVLLVESDRLLYSTDIDARPGASFEIPVTAEWERHDVYVTALVLRPGGRDEIGPRRAVGVAHVPMTRTDRRIELQLQAPERVRPGEPLIVQLQAPQLAGQQAFVVVDAVDVGIVSITGYPVPDALAHFLAQRRFGIDAFDLYGRIVERLAGKRARLRYGGDAALTALPQARRPTARVQTVAMHHAPTAFDAQGRAQLQFDAPDFNGTLRLAALAWSDRQFGKADAETVVRAPLVLEVSTPRAMAPGDRSVLTVDLQNLSGAAQRYRIEASTAAPLQLDAPAQVIELADQARRTLSFPLTALPGFGVGRFTVKAIGEQHRIERSFEVAIRPAWPGTRRDATRVLQQAQTLSYGSALIEGYLPGSARATLTVSTVPPIPFAASVQGLIGYPYGCIEQTTSRAWPLLWLTPGNATRFGLKPLEDADRRQRLRNAFARIAAMQQASGHFGFWPGEGQADARMTPQVAELLLVAREQGETIPEDVLERALERLSEDLLQGGDGYYAYEYSEHLRFAQAAHAGYVLARIARAPLGTLRALYDHERSKSMTGLPLLHLGLALHLQGDVERGDAAIDEAFAKPDQRPDLLGDLGSQVRDRALMLALLEEHGLMRAAQAEAIMQLASELRGQASPGHWLSTQEQLALFRLGKALLTRPAQALDGVLQIGAREEVLPASALFARDFDAAELAEGVRITLRGEGPFYVAEDVAGTPGTAPAPAAEGLRIRRDYFRMDGKRFDGGELKEGEALIAKLSIESAEMVPDALVIDLLPAGVEIENLALGDSETLGALVLDGISLSERHYSAEIRHQEFRDDRYVAALRLWGNSPAHLFYLVRAVSPGTFVVPPPFVEDMYRPRLRGLGEAKPAQLRVVPPK